MSSAESLLCAGEHALGGSLSVICHQEVHMCAREHASSGSLSVICHQEVHLCAWEHASSGSLSVICHQEVHAGDYGAATSICCAKSCTKHLQHSWLCLWVSTAPPSGMCPRGHKYATLSSLRWP